MRIIWLKWIEIAPIEPIETDLKNTQSLNAGCQTMIPAEYNKFLGNAWIAEQFQLRPYQHVKIGR
jgi:hypothetical protein